LSGRLNFGIGEIQVSASREQLKYSTLTKKALVTKINSLIEEFVRITFEEIDSLDVTPWIRRIRLQILNELKLPVPKNCKELASDSVTLYPSTKDQPTKDPTHFVITRYDNAGSITHRIDVDSSTKLLLKDDGERNIKGYNLLYNHHLVRPLGTSTWEEVTKELDEVVEKAGIRGIPIEKLSDIPWHPPAKKFKEYREKNIKHQRKVFILNSGIKRYDHPWSANWEAELRRTPQLTDVFVILQDFKTDHADYNFYQKYCDDRNMAEEFGGVMPPIYGYKSTQKKPLTDASCIGVPYLKWREPFLKNLATPEVEKQLQISAWYTSNGSSYSYRYHDTSRKLLKKLREKLGNRHLLSVYVERMRKSKLAFATVKSDRRQALNKLNSLLNQKW
jgi:hypothetical protein